MARQLRGLGGKGRATKTNELFLKLEKKNTEKNVAKGGGGLCVRALKKKKKNFFWLPLITLKKNAV